MTIRLASDGLTATILPELGAGLAALDALDGGRNVALLRPVPDAPAPLDLGLNVLAPFSNRISQPFTYGGATHAVPCNLPGERYPIHGDAFLKAWRVANASASSATLTLAGEIGPYHYDAQLDYALRGARLDAALTLTNRGAALPFGGGFHPWFRRDVDTVCAFKAEAVYTETADHLPADRLMLSQSPDWRFDTPRALPADWINNAFLGWERTARLAHPSLGIETVVRAEPPLDVLVVHARTLAEPFVCLEPVSHPPDAHNLPGQPGLVPLQASETLRLAMSVEWMAL
ncbi:MAG: aldose 1-epimerase [Pseudomonadota bacterium]